MSPAPTNPVEQRPSDDLAPNPKAVVVGQVRVPSSTDPTGHSDVFRITFQTAAGTQSFITVAASDYSAVHVRQLLAEAAAEIDAVDHIGHQEQEPH